MKLKCNHDRRVHILPSSTVVHRSDGTKCSGKVTIGGKKVVGRYTTIEDISGIHRGNLVLEVSE